MRGHRRARASAAAGLLLSVAFCLPFPAAGHTAAISVAPGGGHLAEALAAARPGDLLVLEPGIHRGPVTVDRPRLALQGEAGAVVDGGGRGRVIEVAAPSVVIRGLTIRNSGTDFTTVDAGIFVGQAGAGASIEGNRLTNNLFGVYLHGPERAAVRDNRIDGGRNPRVNDRGNGVHLWNAPGSVIEDNDIRFGRDGIFVTTSARNVFRGNRFRDLRFAVHSMYANDAEIVDNISMGNHTGYALMYSRHLHVHGNSSEGDRDHGILLNYVNESGIAGNVVRRGGSKCVFLYNANKNRLRDNRFEGCRIGIHFTAGSARNIFAGNAFIGNETQVKYVGTRLLEWSHEGRGNYWSDNAAFDLNGDGIADAPYKPNGLLDQVLWRHPLSKLLLNSPAMRVLRWSQEQFPALYPGGVIDSAPLMRPPPTLASPDILENGA